MKAQQDKLKTARRNELDWLRVLAFGLLIFYHIGMYYVADWNWHIKSPHQSEWLQIVMLWSGQWRMLLLFLISGSAVAFILRRMTLRQFYWSRYTRVLLPLLFGMAVIVVPQVFAEGRLNGMIADDVGFFRVWFAYLNQSSNLFVDHKTVGGWHVTWNHLWFLMYVFCYSLIIWGLKCVSLSVESMVRRAASNRRSRDICRDSFWGMLEQRVPLVLLVLAPVILFSLYGKFIYPYFPITHAFFDDFFNHARYLTAFIFGYSVVRMPRVWECIRGIRWYTLMTAVLSFAVVHFLHKGGSFGGGDYKTELDNFVWSFNAWAWVLVVCGWGQRWLNRPNPVIHYLDGGVYCYYIVHQTVIISFAYIIRDYGLGSVIEPVLLILVTVISCLLGYELIRRVPGLRLLMGVVR